MQAQTYLRQLELGSKEFLELQSVLLKASGIVELIFSDFKVDTAQHPLGGGFGSSEHMAIGEAVRLKMDGLPANTPLLKKGAALLHFHHIVALAGDFYGVPGQAISLPGGTDQKKKQRFQNAFDELVKADNHQVLAVVQALNEECMSVRNSSLPHHCYSSQLLEKSRAIKKVKPDVDDLLIDNSDHFSTNAWDAYRIGHALALEMAREAGSTADLENRHKKLKDAYALDAFACHFLTDLFAAGHVRNQRGPLETFLLSLGFSESKAKPLAGILTGAQHERDGNDGLNVTNEKGEYWRAYGDGCYAYPQNEENRNKAIAATQKSVDEIYEAYQLPNVEPISVVHTFIPRATEYNPLPLYTVVENNGVLTLILNRAGVTIQALNHR